MTPLNDDELEQLLKAQLLRQPSAELDRRVMTQLQQPIQLPQDERAPNWWRPALALAACAVLAAGIWLVGSQPGGDPGKQSAPTAKGLADPAAAASPLAGFDPVRIDHAWSRIAPDGVVTVDDGDPLRRYRRRTLRHTQFIDEGRNIRIEYTEPRDDLLVMPVRYD